jgi:hypothetical protein
MRSCPRTTQPETSDMNTPADDTAIHVLAHLQRSPDTAVSAAVHYPIPADWAASEPPVQSLRPVTAA